MEREANYSPEKISASARVGKSKRNIPLEKWYVRLSDVRNIESPSVNILHREEINSSATKRFQEYRWRIIL